MIGILLWHGAPAAANVKVRKTALSPPRLHPPASLLCVSRGEVPLTTTCHFSTDPLIYKKEAQALRLYAARLDLEAERRRMKTGGHALETERSRSLSGQLSGPMGSLDPQHSGPMESLTPQRSGPFESLDSKHSGPIGSRDSNPSASMGKQKRALLTRDYDYR